MRLFDVPKSLSQLRVKLTRTGVVTVILVLVLAAALALDVLPGSHWTHHHTQGMHRHTRAGARKHVALNGRYGRNHRSHYALALARHVATTRPSGNCRVRYRHHGATTLAARNLEGGAPRQRRQTADSLRLYRPVGNCRIRYRHHSANVVASQPHHKRNNGTIVWRARQGAPANSPLIARRPHAPVVIAARPRPLHKTPSSSPAPVPATVATVPGVQRAYLNLFVNGIDEGEVLAQIHNGDVAIPIADLSRAGLHGLDHPTQTVDGQPYVLMRSLAPGVTYSFNDRDLALRIFAQPQYFPTNRIDMGGNAPSGIIYGKSTSGFFNYAVDWLNFKQLTEFSELGVSSHGALYYTGFSIMPGGAFIRGLTNATFDNPANMKRWVVGDTFADGGVLGGGTFLGGLSVSRNFSLNPYFVRYPGVGLSGQVLTPSTADIYVNGHLIGTRALPPGQFDIQNLPVVAGGGTTQVVVRDAFGRTQTLSSSYYYSTTVLQRGLSEYSYNLGGQRTNLATSSSDYGPLVFVGFDRVGITNWFTAGARLDGGAGLVSGGPTAALRLGRGQLGINGALSHVTGIGGSAAEADYSYQNRFLSFGATLAATSSHYATVSLASTADRATSLASAFAGFEIGPRASVTLNYATAQWRDSGPRQDLSIAGSVRLSNKLDLAALAQHINGTSSANQYSLSLSYQIGRNTLGAVSQQGGSLGAGSAVSVQQSLPLGAGTGYRFEHGNGSQIQNDDLAQVQTSFGLYQAAYLQMGSNAQKDILASGGLVDAGDGIMFTRAVQDGYAVIDVPGVRGVRGYFNNQEIGRTDAKGRLLVPNLLAYYGNRIEISDQDVPLDYSVDATEETVAPAYRGGALVRFPVKREVAITGLMVVDGAREQIVPSFGQMRITIGGRALVSELNDQGQFYLEDVQPGRYAGEVEYADGSCAFKLIVPDDRAAVTQLGRVRCTLPQVGGRAAQTSDSAVVRGSEQ